MSKESLKKTLKQEPKKDETEVIQESEIELDLEDLDEVAGGFYPWRPTEKPTRYYPIVPPSNSDN